MQCLRSIASKNTLNLEYTSHLIGFSRSHLLKGTGGLEEDVRIPHSKLNLSKQEHAVVGDGFLLEEWHGFFVQEWHAKSIG
mmetsp:Transcript_22853/g.35114  ORF Transcript_22853/g.35114 Transcript_22853/m.35114 type:complete len:81 (+) Transcript_22853:459-701(+)